MTSYLSNRFQHVEIDGHKSDSQQLNYGVPQGSVLGAFLFLSYINDFQKTSSFKLTQFADDTLLYTSMSSKNITSLEHEVNHAFIEVQRWIDSNKLTINLSKSKFMLIALGSVDNDRLQNSVLKIRDQKLERRENK